MTGNKDLIYRKVTEKNTRCRTWQNFISSVKATEAYAAKNTEVIICQITLEETKVKNVTGDGHIWKNVE